MIYSTSFSQDFKEPSYTKSVKKIQEKTFKDLETKFNLIPLGSGGAMRNGISQLSLSCIHYGTLSLEESRRLIIDAAQTFLDNVNSEEKLQPHLKPSPCKIPNIEIMISIKNKDGSRPKPNLLNILSITDSKIEGESYSEQKGFFMVLSETYEEAISKLKTEANKK